MKEYTDSLARSSTISGCLAKATLNRSFTFGALLLMAMLWPSITLANAGTPLMWARTIHLVIGNLGIGIVEGWMLALLFKRGAVWCILTMIAANYFSAWAGGIFLTWTISQSLDLDLYNAWRWVWVMVAITYLLTLVLEWPFVALCLRKRDGWFSKSIYGSLIVQTVSYLALVGWYWMASGTSLYTEMTIVQPSEIRMTQGAMLYYIAESDGDAYALDLNGGEVKKIATLESSKLDDRLLLRGASDGPGRWDLVARAGTADWKTILPGIVGQAAVSPRDTRDLPDGSWFNFGDVPRIGTDKEADWRFSCGFWPTEGLHGENGRDGRQFRLCMETPFAEWVVRNATQLPDDKVIFQLGTQQICVVDPESRQVALLARGRGPVVVIVRRTTASFRDSKVSQNVFPMRRVTTMARDANKSATAFQELVRVLEEAVRAGCDSVELEWEGRDLAAFQCLGNAAIGTFPFPRALQQVVLDELVQRAGLARKSKGKIPLTLLGENYEVLVLEHDSFGESAFVLKFKKIKKKPAAANDQT